MYGLLNGHIHMQSVKTLNPKCLLTQEFSDGKMNAYIFNHKEKLVYRQTMHKDQAYVYV